MKTHQSVIPLVLFVMIALSCNGVINQSFRQTRCFESDYHVGMNTVNEYIQNVVGIRETKVNSVSVEPIVCHGDTVMYLVNYQDGWELLSGDVRASRVLVSCEGSNITFEELLSSPAQNTYFSALRENLSRALHDDSIYDEDVADSWIAIEKSKRQIDRLDPSFGPRVVRVLDSITRTTVFQLKRDHLLSTKWGQSSPWNSSAPFTSPSCTNRCLTGCTPVAAAQVLYYLHNKFGVPSAIYGNASCNAYLQNSSDTLILSSSDITFSNWSSSHWDNMPLNNSASSGFDKVSALMMRIGYLFGARYQYDITTANPALATTIFPTEYSITCDQAIIYSNSSLNSVAMSQIYDQRLPMIMTVSYTDVNDNYHGHAIVLDGYRYLQELVTYHYSYYITDEFGFIRPGQEPDSHDTTSSTESSYCVGINWGGNGYGDSDSFGNTIWYNIFTNWVVSIYEYTNKNKIIFHFAPLE